MKQDYFCCKCFKKSKDIESLNHDCPDYCVVLRPLHSGLYRFLSWFSKVDIIYYLSFSAGTIINALIMNHSNWSFNDQLIESICIGFILIRILKNE